jgi:hypothetical protein
LNIGKKENDDDPRNLFYLGQDDTVYTEHHPIPLKLIDRPPSSPSRFDLKKLYRSQSQYQIHQPVQSESTKLFEIVHRSPSQSHIRLRRHKSDLTAKFKSSSFQEEKPQQQQQQSDKQKQTRPQTVPTVPATYEVKRGGKIHKVIVGYVSPFTSPLQRKELHLKTDGEVDLVTKQIKQQQEKQRASKPQVWLGLSPSQLTLK